MLNPEAPIPLYRQLANELEERIFSGNLVAGAKIPSEHELATTHGIGRPTVRQATDYLVRLGLLERKRGSGTFVRPAKAHVDLFTLGGTMAAFEGAGLALETQIVEAVSRLTIPDPDAGPLGERSRFRFTRLGRLEAEPVLVEYLYLDAVVFPGLDELSVDREPLSRLVQRHYHRRPRSGTQTIRVGKLSERETLLLRVQRDQHALFIERTLDFVGAPAALFARIVALTDRVALTQTLVDPNFQSRAPGSEEERE